jgi:hypothetical protein
MPLAALGLAIWHGVSPDKPKIDAIIIALLVIAILPWISTLIESLKYGELEIKLRDIVKKTEEAKGAAESARLLVITQTESERQKESRAAAVEKMAGKPPLQQLEQLVAEYKGIRAANPPSDYRTRLMTRIMTQMREVARSLPESDMLLWLRDEDPARRLAAYAFFYENPEFAQVDALVKSVMKSDNPPFAQYWGILALERVIGVRGQATVSNQTKVALKHMLSELKPGTDRQYELLRLIQSLD